MRFRETNQLPRIPMIISVLEEKKSAESVTRKVNWEKYGFPLAYKLSLPESNQCDILPISSPHISYVISWSWDSACDFKFYKCNIIRKCWHKHIIIWVSMQTIYSCKEQLPSISIKYFFYRKSGRGREGGRRDRKCVLQKENIFI